MKFIKRLFGHYESLHVHGPLMLRYLSILGFVAFPAFYLLRYTKASPTYDDLAIRLVDAALCLALFFKDRWPSRLKPYYFGYSYLVLIVTLPLTFVFTSLKQGGGTVAVGNTLMAVFIVILLTDWRNSIVVLSTGFVAGALLYVATEADPAMPNDYVQRLPILVAVLVGGSLFKFAAESATAEKVRSAYASLAGSIAHEMRNPLSQLHHNLEDMQKSLPAPTTTGQPQMLEAAAVDALYRHLAQGELAVRRGLQVISMTLDEVNAKPMDAAGFAYLSAADVCFKAVREYGYESEEERERVRVRVARDFNFRGDETACLFALFNLIKNALYYFESCPQACVTITVDLQRIEVHDSGPGISPEKVRHLFEPFISSGKSGGTGLGLAYCRRVMLALGGDIGCESVVGQFTRFTLRFPPVSEPEREAHRLSILERVRGDFAGKRLLIVDDDAAQRMTTRHKLQPLGVQVDQAADGRRALEALSRTRYDLVLLDLNMPVLDGYAVAEQIRAGQVPAHRDVRIVAYTSEPVHLAAVKTQKAGMDGCVTKPCDQLPLILALHQALLRPAVYDPAARLLAGRRVLLADDNPYNRKAVAAYLRHAGAEVSEAGHGRGVLEQLALQAGWDAVLMDINMPGMGGLEATRAIRSSAQPWHSVPVIALTAHLDAQTLADARAAGMNEFITKPVQAEVLYAALQRLIGVAAGAPAPAPAAATSTDAGLKATDPAASALDLDRLESYRRIGMLDELLRDYLPEISRLVAEVEQGIGRQDLDAVRDSLHSLLGMSGEAGAAALYRLVREAYVPMAEGGSWPRDSNWLRPIREAAAEAQAALKSYGAMHSALTAG